MGQKEIQFRKKRDIGEIITDSFEFLKQEYKPILRLLIVYVLPFLILYSIVQVNIQIKLQGTVDFEDPEFLTANMGPLYQNLFFSLLFTLFVQSLLVGTYYSYIETYIKKGRGNFNLSDITPSLFSNGLLALGANIVVFFISLIGFMLCFLPGFYFANTLSLALVSIIINKKGISDALTVSWNLVNRAWWNTFLLNILGVIFIWGIGFIITIPLTISGLNASLFSLNETGTAELPDWYWVVMGISTVVSSLFWVIPYTFLAFQYFNLAERVNIRDKIEPES